MEATGVYWVVLKDINEAEKIEVVLVKGGDARQLALGKGLRLNHLG